MTPRLTDVHWPTSRGRRGALTSSVVAAMTLALSASIAAGQHLLVPDAAALMLNAAARIIAARGNDSGAVALWQRVVEQYPNAPEAAEADLEWARVLRRRGDTAAAVQRLEHMILTYPRSALVPQARRELDLAKQSVPST